MKEIKKSPDAATGSTTAMNKLVQSFNEMMKEKVRKDFEGHIASTEEAGIYDEELDYVCCSFDYGFDYEYEWREFAWEQDKVQPSVAVEFYRDNGEMFIDMDAMYEYVEKLADEYGVGLDDHCGGQCLIWVKNPYYVSSVLETASTTANEDMEHMLIDYLMSFDDRPSWVKKDVFDFENGGDYFDIIMFGSYHIKLHYNPEYKNTDVAVADDGLGYGKYDLYYAAEIMDNRSTVLDLAKKAGYYNVN